MSPARASLPLTLFAGGLAFLTAWTLGVQAITFAGGPFVSLYVALAAAVAAGAAATWCARRLEPVWARGVLLLPAVRIRFAALGAVGGSHGVVLVVLTALFIAAALLEHAGGAFTPLYAVLVATAGYALVRTRVTPGAAVLEFQAGRPARAGVALTPGTLALVALLLLLYFLTNVPDADDSLYLNLAVGAKHARAAVYATDSMLGIPGLPLIKSTYRLESMQLLAAVLSDLSGLPVIDVAHAVIPALLCVLAAAVLALVYHALFGRAWFAPALMHIAWLLAMRPGLSSYGHDAVTRFFHGKAFFLTTMAPLLAVLTVLAVRGASRAPYVLLGASLIASIGLTANAVYVGPLTVALPAAPLMLLGNVNRRQAALRLGTVLAYPALAIAALLLLSPPGPSEVPFDIGLGSVLQDGFGSAFALGAAMLLMFGAAGAALLQRRLAPVSVTVLVALLLVFNPVLWRLYGEHVTGHLNYRLLWAVPFPLLLSMVSGVLWINAPAAVRLGGAALLAAMAAAGLADISWGFAPVKVPQPDYAIAREVNELSPCGGLILAPEEISTWITTLENARPVVEGRGIYTPQRVSFMPKAQYRDRWLLFAWVSQLAPGAADVTTYLSALRRLGVRVVVVHDPGAAQRSIRDDPRAGEFTLARQIGPYQLYFVDSSPTSSAGTESTRLYER